MNQNPNNPVPYQLPNQNQHPPRKPLSLFKRILIIIFCAVSFFGIWETFFPSQPPPPTKTTPPQTSLPSWKTYTNTTYAYSISYPTHLQPTSQSPYTTKFTSKQNQITNNQPPLYITVIPPAITNQNNEIFNFLPENTINTLFALKDNQTHPSFKKLTTITIQDTPAIILQNDSIPNADPGLSERRIILKKNNHAYILGSYYQTQQQLNDLRAFLSSFKLL